MNIEEVSKKVIDLLIKVLDVESDEIKLESLLFSELDVESAEILEITFRVEREFNISIGEGEFWNIADVIANEGMFENGKFSDEAKKLIKENINVSDEEIDKLSSPFQVYDYISIKDLVDFIYKKLNK